MNLGILLTGISHLTHNERWPIPRSYISCKQNYIDELYTPLSKKFKQCKVFLATYKSSESENILNFYNPSKYIFLDSVNSHQIKTFISGLDLIEDCSGIDYFIITRFDIFFNPGQLSKLKFDLNKFNFLCKEKDYWESHQFVNDCFYFLPKKYLPHLKLSCQQLLLNPPRPPLMDMHGLYKWMKQNIQEYNINFLSDSHYNSGGNEIYSLKRLR